MSKAYVTFCENPMDGCLLVFAETANKARYKCNRHGLFGWDYVEISALRQPDFDKYSDLGPTIECNDDLPEGVEFYLDIEV